MQELRVALQEERQMLHSMAQVWWMADPLGPYVERLIWHPLKRKPWKATPGWEGAKYALYANVWKIHAMWSIFIWTGACNFFPLTLLNPYQ